MTTAENMALLWLEDRRGWWRASNVPMQNWVGVDSKAAMSEVFDSLHDQGLVQRDNAGDPRYPRYGLVF